jgi:hypothetical protein
MKRYKQFLVLGFSILLTACASTMHLSEQDKERIKSVSVSDTVKQTDEFFYQGPKMGVAGVFGGAIGAMAMMPANDNEGKNWQNYFKTHNIDIAKILKNNLKTELSKQTYLKVKNKEADTVIHLDIKQYGLTIPNGLSSQLKPSLIVYATMTDKSGKTIWKDSTSILAFSRVPAYTTKEYINDPQKMIEAWQGATKLASERLVRALKK